VNIERVMDEVGAALAGIDGLRVHAWPVATVVPPAAVVLFPRQYAYDLTYGRGSDRLTLPVAVMVGRITERTAKTSMAGFLDGSGDSSVKRAVEHGLYQSLDSVRVTGVDVDVMTMGGVDYWGAVFELDIAGPGSIA
jgi:hypothetical protein